MSEQQQRVIASIVRCFADGVVVLQFGRASIVYGRNPASMVHWV